MVDRSLTRRYVTALFRLAAEAGLVERVRDELQRLQAAMAHDPRVVAVLRHPDIPPEEKRRLLLRAASEAPTELAQGFVDVLLRKGRIEVLFAAADAFTEVADEDAGVVRGTVEVAYEPDADQRHRLEAALARLVGAPVVAEYRMAPDIIAGARVQIAGQLIDGTLTGKLDAMVRRATGEP